MVDVIGAYLVGKLGCQGGRRPGGAAADTGFARVFRRSRNGLRPKCCGLQAFAGRDGLQSAFGGMDMK